jgi:hypothetical protein
VSTGSSVSAANQHSALKATHSSGVSPKHRYRLWHCLVSRLGDGDQIRAVPSAAKMPESRTRFRFMELAWENIHCIWNSPSRCSSRCSRSSAYSSRSLSSPTMRSGSCSARTSCLPAENSAVDSADASLGGLPGIDRHEPSWSLRLLPFQCRSRHLTSILLTATGSSDLWLLEAPQKRKNRMPRVWCHIFRTRHASQSAFPGNSGRVFEVLPFNPSRALRVDAAFFYTVPRTGTSERTT